jgi:hypothetical protein
MDLLELIEKHFGKKFASILAIILGVTVLIFFVWLIATYWKDIDFGGRGGTPYGDAGCYYGDCD